ncbi:pseudouridylate synthase [Trypanosoma conorhini]|uniref:Pseudouridylate synthase n=1 Tax=Trypanosoma conorhini TaxID=83891 RepID=A0A3R7LJA5_9TRYP|nr:pseudouridylate synthase [Trypanosoma conorhini]RNF25723.1 pseudouridylate synthase [Trypanosoma conorhini]
MAAENVFFGVIYANEELVVVNKPHDVPMDGEEHSLTVEKWATAYRAKRDCAKCVAGGGADGAEQAARTACRHAGRRKSVKFVHQLDYATSGVLCVAFSKEMAARLAHCFEVRTTQKAYLAVLRGMIPSLRVFQEDRNPYAGVDFLTGTRYGSRVHVVPVDEVPNAGFVRRCVLECSRNGEEEDADGCAALLRVDLPVGYDTTDPEGFRMAVNGRDARESVTYVHVLQRGYMSHPSSGCPVPVTKVALFPRTGRRHQLRVHCHAVGFPILGDVTYAGIPTPRPAPERQGTESMATSGAAGSADVADETGTTEAWQRMMLHAWRLSFPVSVEPLQCGKERYMQKRRRRRETLGLAAPSGDDAAAAVWTHFETKDPFHSVRPGRVSE